MPDEAGKKSAPNIETELVIPIPSASEFRLIEYLDVESLVVIAGGTLVVTLRRPESEEKIIVKGVLIKYWPSSSQLQVGKNA